MILLPKRERFYLRRETREEGLDGGGEDGEMPTGTAWAKLVAAKKSGPRKLVDRMLKCEGGLL